jgi:peptidoglycan/LPS O-acetylase OafA/YrhL
MTVTGSEVPLVENSEPAVTQDAEPKAATHRRKDIDGLRGIAVLAVVGYHFFPEWIHAGYIGVDVFFVISGFVITALLMRDKRMTIQGLASFWGRRIRRLIPALITVLVVTAILGWFVMWPTQYAQLGQSMSWSSIMLGNIYQWNVTDYFASEPTWNPLLNLWSLGVEEQFYLVWPLVMGALLVVWNRTKNLTIILVALSVLSAWLFTFAWTGNHSDSTSSYADVFYLPWFRAWELGVGALAAVALAHPKIRKKTIANTKTWMVAYLLLLVGLIVSLVLPKTSLNPATYALAAVALTVALIVIGAFFRQSDRITGNPGLLFFGRISYSLYLWHWPLLSLMLSAGIALTISSGLALFFISVCAAYGTWRLVEAPFLARKLSWKLVVTILISLGLVATLGVAISRNQGFPGRTSALAAELSNFTYEQSADYRTGSCFVEQLDGQSTSTLKNCFADKPGKNNILLWGDSFAASFYRGLESVAGTNSTITQLNVAGCQPQLAKDATVTMCQDMDSLAMSGVKAGRFDTVILMGVWNAAEAQPLVNLVRQIKATSSAKIMVVGPLPQWSPSLPRAWSFRQAQALGELPKYSNVGLLQQPFEVASAIRASLAGEGVIYLDPLEQLCNTDGCLVTTDGTVQGLTAWDYAHLTKAGSEHLAQALLAETEW